MCSYMVTSAVLQPGDGEGTWVVACRSLEGGGSPITLTGVFDTHCKYDQEGHKNVRPVLRRVTAHHGICSCAGV